MGKLRAFLLLLLPALCLAQYVPPGTSGSGISACSTSPPTAGAAHATCYDTAGVIWQCNNGSSACTTSGQWVSQGGSVAGFTAGAGVLTGPATNLTIVPFVNLQSSTPGTPQTGSLNISGAGIFGGSVTAGTTVLGGSGYTPVTYSATPTFTVSSQTDLQTFVFTLTGNVTSSTLTAATAVAGQSIGFMICQDGTGGHTFAWPSNVRNPAVIDSTPSACTRQLFTWTGSQAVSTSVAISSAAGTNLLTAGGTIAFPAAPAVIPGVTGGLLLVNAGTVSHYAGVDAGNIVLHQLSPPASVTVTPTCASSCSASWSYLWSDGARDAGAGSSTRRKSSAASGFDSDRMKNRRSDSVCLW
jgi:hypothetical protein